jgi:hypothetical protein
MSPRKVVFTNCTPARRTVKAFLLLVREGHFVKLRFATNPFERMGRVNCCSRWTRCAEHAVHACHPAYHVSENVPIYPPIELRVEYKSYSLQSRIEAFPQRRSSVLGYVHKLQTDAAAQGANAG